MNFKSCVRALHRMVVPFRGKVALSVALGVVSISTSLGFVWICKRLVDIATKVIDAPLWPAVWTMLGIMTLNVSVGIASSYWENYISTKARNEMRERYFSHAIRSRWNGMEVLHTGDTVNRLEEDVRVVVELICSRIPAVIVTLLQLIAASVYLLMMAPGLVWLLLVLMAVAVVCSKMFFKIIRALTSDIRKAESEIQETFQENLENRILILTLGAADKIISKLRGIQSSEMKLTIKRLNYNAVARGFMSFGFSGGYAAAFLWGIFGIAGGTVTFGMMTAFLQLVGQVQRPIADLGRNVPAFIYAMSSVERLEELTDQPIEEKGEDLRMEGAPQIEFRNVSYSYPNSSVPVFSDFNCTFKSGTMTAVMGPTGKGKTTLIRLVLALLSPDSGQVLINGTPVNADTRCNFMYVPQGNSLMSGTVRENLLLANPSASEEDMYKALETAVAGFVRTLPLALDTMCGEKGTGLSEGQAQRIAIARALLHKGGVMILDEATSALDSETERQLIDNLNKSCKAGRTIIFITHRGAVVPLADDILNV